MTVQELTKRHRELESEAKALSATILSHEARVDKALELLTEVLPDVDVENPREIPFDNLIAEAEKRMKELTTELEEAMTALEELLETAHGRVESVVNDGRV